MDAGTAIARVEALVELRRYEQAVDAAREGLVANAEDQLLQSHLAWALVLGGRAKGRLAAAESAVRLAPDQEFPHRLRAHALLNYAMFANEGGQYDDLLAYIKEHRLA